MSHDGGAFARCSYCGRYSDNPDALSTRGLVCDCGQAFGWSGSFKQPVENSKWSECTEIVTHASRDRQ